MSKQANASILCDFWILDSDLSQDRFQGSNVFLPRTDTKTIKSSVKLDRESFIRFIIKIMLDRNLIPPVEHFSLTHLSYGTDFLTRLSQRLYPAPFYKILVSSKYIFL